jgi:hypothetical protein
MISQIFKNQIPNELLIKILNNIAVKNDKCYVLNNNSYKKGLFNESIQNFIGECLPYYHLSKRKYLERKLTYNSFITIIRQICNFNNIVYTSQIKYDKSAYDIVYYIYL